MRVALLAGVRCCPSRAVVLSNVALQFSQSPGTVVGQRCVCQCTFAAAGHRTSFHLIRVVCISILFPISFF